MLGNIQEKIKTNSLSEKLYQLQDIKNKELISDEEYNHLRQSIFDNFTQNITKLYTSIDKKDGFINNQKLHDEIAGFERIGCWKGGYRIGYSHKRNQRGVEMYLNENLDRNACILEIGCGGGQWSKYIYDLGIHNQFYCIDVLSEEHNKFWEYVGNEKRDKIIYYNVMDFDLSEIPDDSLDFVFSYDVFCHISYSGQYLYLKNLYKKCKKNCKLMIMYADPEKYLKSEPEHLYHVKEYLPGGRNKQYHYDEELIQSALNDCDGKPSNGRWYWIGMNKFLELCEMFSYNVLDRDLNIDKTNCITLFKKP